MMKAVDVAHIAKTFTTDKTVVTALHDISFDVNKGELYGIIGPDGAGKTTLFRLLTTLMIADSGKATVEGFDVVNDYQMIRKQVGYMPGKFSLYPDLTVQENLEFFATLFNTSIATHYDLIKDIYSHIEKFNTRKAADLSGGMKQKLALCCALIHRPTILFLDEPTTGVDAVSRKEFWELLRRLQAQDITIVVSTPYMDEASLCDRVALIQEGQILDIDTPHEMTKKFNASLWRAEATDMYLLMKDFNAQDAVISCYPFGQFHHVTLTEDNKSAEVIQAIKACGHDLTFEKIPATIEDCFMELMQHKAQLT